MKNIRRKNHDEFISFKVSALREIRLVGLDARRGCSATVAITVLLRFRVVVARLTCRDAFLLTTDVERDYLNLRLSGIYDILPRPRPLTSHNLVHVRKPSLRTADVYKRIKHVLVFLLKSASRLFLRLFLI